MQNTYTETFSVRATDCDRFRRMRLDMLFIAMQEGGERHAQMLGVGYQAMMERGLFFVLARIHVHTVRAPRVGETVVHTTWPGKSNRFFCPRYHTFALEDGTPLLSAAALWVVLDTANRRIVSPTSLDLGLPDNGDIPEPVSLPNRLPAGVSGAQSFARTPVYSEFDINGHVNNTKYIAWLCDTLGSDALDGHYIGDLVASYEKEIRDEAPLTLSLAREGDAFSFLVSADNYPKHFTAGGTLRKEEAL
ncbi:MAG: thioesterase [Eubacteriales bacterium]|nr:thioesterase [Eubacteriales bacterium]